MVMGECQYPIFEACFRPKKDTFRKLAKLRLQELIFCEKCTDRRSESEFVSFDHDCMVFLSKNEVFRNLAYKRRPGRFFVQNERRDALSPNLILSRPVSASRRQLFDSCFLFALCFCSPCCVLCCFCFRRRLSAAMD